MHLDWFGLFCFWKDLACIGRAPLLLFGTFSRETLEIPLLGLFAGHLRILEVLPLAPGCLRLLRYLGLSWNF